MPKGIHHMLTLDFLRPPGAGPPGLGYVAIADAMIASNAPMTAWPGSPEPPGHGEHHRELRRSSV
ncbi:hypothetical protein GCM10027089_41330 [Nocardia thraciensis]